MAALSATRLVRLHDALAVHVSSTGVPGVVALVSRRGETHAVTLGQRSLDSDAPMTRDTIFRIASMTKPVTAAAAMILVEQCRLRLDEPVDAFLPELASRRVLKNIESPLDDTVPARRSITLRDLLTFTFGLGAIMVWPPKHPIQTAMQEAGVAPNPCLAAVSADEYMKRIGSLPLAYQPGERWLYHTGSEVLGVLIARAAGQSLSAFMHDHLFGPLGMHDTGFQVPADKVGRLASNYMTDPKDRTKLAFFDDARDSRWGRPPAFESGGGGLVSTVDDYLAFQHMLLNKGRHRGARILSRPSVGLMMTDQLNAAQKQGTELFFGDSASWGFGGAVITRRTDLWASPGRYGWDGGYGSSAHLDPTEDLAGILMTTRMMESPQPPRVFGDFWTSAYQAIDD
jgi:CubicO group peptidase (beta-lactamase class C family)